MRLPDLLRAAIDDIARAVDPRELAHSAARLSERYRAISASGAISNAADRAAYLVARMPATFAADEYVLSELTKRVSTPVRSLLDLGSGPGTALWAAAEVLQDLGRFTAIEREDALIETARQLASRNIRLNNAKWVQADLQTLKQFEEHDVVVMSYALGELADPAATVREAWNAAQVGIVIIEPGTPAAFQNVVRARDILIADGAYIAAPCPHHNVCPLAARSDWCHFSVRLERSSSHRRLKGGDLSYEDEKFSYVIATKTPAHRPAARIVRHPLKHPGHVKLTLCTPDDLQEPTVTKSQKALYRAARKAEWGDAWPPDFSGESVV